MSKLDDFVSMFSTGYPEVSRELHALRAEVEMLRGLLKEWRTLPGEPHPGEGLVSTSEVIDEYDVWNTIYIDLASRTDAILSRK